MKKSNRYFQLLGGTPEGVVLKSDMLLTSDCILQFVSQTLCPERQKIPEFTVLRLQFPQSTFCPRVHCPQEFSLPGGGLRPPASMNNPWRQESKTAFDRSRLQHPDRVLSAGKVAQEGRPLLSLRFSLLGVHRSIYPSHSSFPPFSFLRVQLFQTSVRLSAGEP
jgi:hypothetical protein